MGITHTSESNIMVEVLAKYSSFSEGTRITIISDAINNLYMKLKTYEIDLAIVEGRITDPNFNSVMLDTDSLILAVSNKNPLSKKSMVTLNELKKENLILRLRIQEPEIFLFPIWRAIMYHWMNLMSYWK